MPDALMITSSFLPGRGGIESYLAEMCDVLAPRIAVMAPARRDGTPLPTDLAYVTVPGKGRMLAPTAALAGRVARTARELGTDRILFGTPWPLGLLGPRLRRMGLRYASLTFGAELFVPGATPFLRRRFTRALASADLLLPMSEFTESRLRILLARSSDIAPEIEVMRARVDLARFTPEADVLKVRSDLGLTDGDKVILYFGRLVRRKGVHRLIEVLPELSERHPEAALVVAGSGPQEGRLRRMAAKTRGRIVFAGPVPDEHAAGLYAAAAVFVLPVVDRWFGLETEGLGIVLLEAAACGTPCVAGRSGGTREAVVDGITGLLVNANDEHQLTAAISRLLGSPEEAARMGRRGREFVEREYPGNHVPASLLRWLG